MPTNKPHVAAKYWPIINQARSFIHNSALFGRNPYGFTGSDNLADTKHAKMWQDFGYPEQLEFYMHWHMWRRNGLARRGAKLPVDITWLTFPWVEESSNENNADESQYELAFAEFESRLNVFESVRDGDLCQRIGRYGALLWTVADGRDKSQPLKTVNSSRVLRVQPLFEGQLEVATTDNNKNSPRYGLPVTYSLQRGNTGNRNEDSVDGGTVHYTRITILTEDALGNDIYGIPCAESSFNALLNWQKVQGAGGEGFWRQAAQRFVLQATGGEESKEFDAEELTALGEMVAKMFAGFDAIPSVGNYEMKGLNTGTLSNPDGFRQMALEEIAAGYGIPSKLLVGTQTGVKAADEDSAGYMREMQSRRNSVVTPWIRDIIDWLDEHTEIKKPVSGVQVCWDDLTAPSAMQKIELATKMASINKTMFDSGSEKPYTANEIREAGGYDMVEQLPDWDDELDLPDVDDADVSSDE